MFIFKMNTKHKYLFKQNRRKQQVLVFLKLSRVLELTSLTKILKNFQIHNKAN